MKTLILIIVLFSVSESYAQTVNEMPIADIDQKYVRIVGTNTIKGRVSVDIDFGQRNKFFSKKDTQIRGADGKKIEFNTMVDALNFMYEFGYEMDQAYAINVDRAFGNQTVYHYLLKRVD